ncbi:glycosyltransferase [Undibacterium sp. TJN25]|uniref:glycosyltransferase n=1 Tax=Undibacterium sp. TJN25 TaxID=3413056 RepID=UPI003BF238A9
MHKERLKISVCIVTYNHAAYIHDCLSSVIAQQVDAELEVLVGDDCSSDETRTIIKQFSDKYPEMIYPIFHKENLGSTRNYQYLINEASGDYIAQLDGDDFWLPGKLRAQLGFLEENRECSAAYTNAIVINNSGDLIAKFNGELPPQFDLNFLLEKGNFLNASSVMYRAHCKYQVLKVDGPILDFHAHVLLASQGYLGYVNKVLVAYRLNSTTSITTARRDLLMELYWKGILSAWKLGADENALRHCMIGFYRSLIRSALTRGRLKEALLVSDRMATECPLVTRKLFILSVMTLPLFLAKEMCRMLGRRIFKGGAEILFDR